MRLAVIAAEASFYSSCGNRTNPFRLSPETPKRVIRIYRLNAGVIRMRLCSVVMPQSGLQYFLRRIRTLQETEALKIVLIYVAFGVAWILFSDRILLELAKGTGTLNWLTRYQTLKGVIFVLLSAGALYLFVRRGLSTISTAHRVLLDSEERFHVFMDNAPVAVFIKDEKGRYEYINATGGAMVGRQASEFQGKTDAELFSLEVAQRLSNADMTVLATGKRLELHERMPAPGGGLKDMLVFKFRLTDSENRRFLGDFAVDLRAICAPGLLQDSSGGKGSGDGANSSS